MKIGLDSYYYFQLTTEKRKKDLYTLYKIGSYIIYYDKYIFKKKTSD